MPPPSAATFAAILAALLPAGALAAEPAPELPRDFRSWMHVRSMVVTDADEGMYGFHDVYANRAAAETLRRRARGQAVPYPEGARFVVSIYEVKQEKGVVAAGAKQRDVMQVKDRRAAASGGWRFASYDPQGKPLAVDAASCVACHAQAKDRDYVFTRLAE